MPIWLGLAGEVLATLAPVLTIFMTALHARRLFRIYMLGQHRVQVARLWHYS